MARIAAVTGATGFLGRHLVTALAAEGWTVRILTRRDPVSPAWRGLDLQVVVGDLADADALARLCAGANLVVHSAGLIKARSPEAFAAVNVDGARALALAAREKAPAAPVLLISSLAAREPGLSAYAASKRAGESAAGEILGDRLTVVRPPVIYGPGDRETLTLFRAAARSPALPVFDPKARIAMIHVEDAARQVARLAADPPGGVVALSDGHPQGYSWRELMGAAAQACGNRPALIPTPGAVLMLVGLLGGAARLLGSTPMLTPGKIRELRHADWSIAANEGLSDPFQPNIGLSDGFRQTVLWYRTMGWLGA